MLIYFRKHLQVERKIHVRADSRRQPRVRRGAAPRPGAAGHRWLKNAHQRGAGVPAGAKVFAPGD